MAEAACPHTPRVHRKRGERCAPGNHVSRLRHGLHLIGSGAAHLSEPEVIAGQLGAPASGGGVVEMAFDCAVGLQA
jgi:hypothetical protein